MALKKCMTCKSDMIYLGLGKSTILNFALEKTYMYICSECGSAEWSSEKERCKYKWYKFDRDKLEELFNMKEED